MRNSLPLLFLIFSASAAIGQSAPPAAAPDLAAPVVMPSDPKEFLKNAVALNSLTTADVQPWHIKASFQIYDDAGKVKDTGSYEELWVSPKRFKRSYSGTGYSVTLYGTKDGVFYIGTDDLPSDYIPTLHASFVEPLPRQEILEKLLADKNSRLSEKTQTFSGDKYRCIAINPSIAMQKREQVYDQLDCFNLDRPMLRIAGSLKRQTIYNTINSFQGHDLPGDVSIAVKGKPVLSAHLESLSLLGAINEADFAPPADAEPLPGKRLKVVPPKYPAAAKKAHVEGTVVIKATIDPTGHVKAERVLSGPELLRQAAVNAVRQWVYQPVTVHGKAVEVKTKIKVAFRLD